MRNFRRQQIPQRRRVFLGCEGESERVYGAFLRSLLEEVRQDVHLDNVLLGGGDPLTLVERSTGHITRSELTKGAPPYAFRALLLDSDLRGTDPSRDQRAINLAAVFSLRLIWQEPCYEALLLRHLPGCHTFRPTTSAVALTRLVQHWTGYEKGMPAAGLGQRLTHADVLRAAGVEPELQAFLTQIGFI